MQPDTDGLPSSPITTLPSHTEMVKKNADAYRLSRLHENEMATSVFPEILKAICQTIVVERDSEPSADSLVPPDTVPDIEEDEQDAVAEDLLSTTALTSQDWRKAQAADDNIRFVIDAVLKGSKPTHEQVQRQNLDAGFFPDWDKYSFRDGVLYKAEVIIGEEFNRLVLPEAFRDLVFKSYHDDTGHQGRDRTTSLIRQRFFWPRMNKFIHERIQSCERCIRRKTAAVKSPHLQLW